MRKERKKTVGQAAIELQQKTPEKVTVVDQQREMQQGYMKHLIEAVDRGYKKYPDNFFVHVETKKERLLGNIVRNYFIDRLTCPTPNYDQSVFHYNRKAGQIEYLWTIPDRETCFLLKDHALQVVKEEQELLRFVMMFDDGTLLRLCKKYNGEEIDSTKLEKN